MADSKVASSFVHENQWSYTEMKEFKCSFTWTIKNRKFFMEESSLKSTSFYVRGKNESKWCLEFYPKNSEKLLYLFLETCLKPPIKVKYKVSILTSEKTKETFQKEGFGSLSPGNSFPFQNFIRRDLLLDETIGIVRDDKLSILCELHVLDEIVCVPGQSLVTVPKCRLLDDFEILFENENFSDVTLTAGGCDYRAHKNILAARSKVFAGMFTHDMEENRSNRVNIADISGEVCKEMLHFIYTGKAPNLDEVAEDLLAAAEKYELTRLKAMCEESLALRLSVENAAATLILAELYDADQLKAETVSFIVTHAFDILQTEGWKNMATSHLHLLMETVLAIAKPRTDSIK